MVDGKASLEKTAALMCGLWMSMYRGCAFVAFGMYNIDTLLYNNLI